MSDKQKKSGLDRLIRDDSSRRHGNEGYSRFVRAMRIFLPLAALVIFTAMVAWPEIGKKLNGASSLAQEVPDGFKNELVNPKFEGVDDQGRPFVVIASKAVQDKENSNIVKLETPVASMTLEDGRVISMEAKEGTYNQDVRRLKLDGNVYLFYDEDCEITTNELSVDLKSRRLWSSASIRGKGYGGALDAKNVSADANTNKLVFGGPVKLVLETKGIPRF